MILPLDCNTADLIASTVDGNYTYQAFASNTSGSDYSTTYNSSIHTYSAIVTSATEIETLSASTFTGKWVPLQKHYTYFAFATSAAGAGFSTTYTGSETYVGLITSATEISTLQASNFAGKWVPLGDTISASDIISFRKTSDAFPINQFLIKNEEFDNTLSSTECTPMTVTSIDTVNNTITLSWLPNIDSIFNPESDKEWLLLDLDEQTYPGVFRSSGVYENLFKITTGVYSTKTLSYTFVGTGTVTATVVGNKMALWNPDMDGYTRSTTNPIITGSQFSSFWTYYRDVDVRGVFKRKSDGVYVMLIGGSNPAGGVGTTDRYRFLYATSNDLINWTPGGAELFTSNRPSWTNAALYPVGNVIYLEEEDMYICPARGEDSLGNNYVGLVRFNEDFSEYSFSTNPIVSTSALDQLNLVDGWKTGYQLNSLGFDRVHSASIIEYKGVWHMIYGNVLGCHYGTHTGSNNASVLTDTSRTIPFVANEFSPTWNGSVVYNLTDGSQANVTANTATTVTGTLSGGTDNDWDTGDEYLIFGLTGRRLFHATSGSPYKPFKHHRAINKESLSDDGALGNSHMETSQLFIYKDELYAIIGETSATDFSGSKGHRIYSLFKLDNNTGDFVRHRKSPVFSAWQYAHSARVHTNFDWELYHTGGVGIPFIDTATNRFYLFYTAKDGSINYEIGVAYMDLNDIL